LTRLWFTAAEIREAAATGKEKLMRGSPDVFPCPLNLLSLR